MAYDISHQRLKSISKVWIKRTEGYTPQYGASSSSDHSTAQAVQERHLVESTVLHISKLCIIKLGVADHYLAASSVGIIAPCKEWSWSSLWILRTVYNYLCTFAQSTGRFWPNLRRPGKWILLIAWRSPPSSYIGGRHRALQVSLLRNEFFSAWVLLLKWLMSY